MNRLIRLLAGLGIGAAGMYFLDPQQGKRRRALLRDQWIHYRTQLPKQMDRKVRHLQNQAQGALHELQSSFGSSDSQPSGQRSDNQPMESQAGRMQSASRNPSASSGDQYFSQQVGASSSQEEENKGPGPGEGGQRAPSRQPQPRTTMDL